MRSDFLLLSKFINIVSILHNHCIEFNLLLYTFLVISFAQNKKYIVDGFHVASFQIYYLLLLVQKACAIFEAFVQELISCVIYFFVVS